jgi:Tol biopolymer transport system component
VAQRFDPRTYSLQGERTILARDVSVDQPTLGLFSASSDLVVYLKRAMVPGDMHMRIFDRTGTAVGTVGDRGVYSGIRISPDGTRLAVARRDMRAGTRDIWIHDLTGRPPVRLTFDGHDDLAPAWSADGKTILFTSDRRGERDVYRKDVAGQKPETVVLSSPESKSLNALSPDGRMLIYDTGARGTRDAQGRANLADLFSVSLAGTTRVRPLAVSPAYEGMADISPDGRLVTYHSSEAGELEVFVETFPDKQGRWQVTTAGGREPIWAANGRELFYLSTSDELCAVDVYREGGGVRFGPQRVLFKIHDLAYTVRKFAPMPDGRRFIVITTDPHPTPQQMTVLVNWRSALPE